MTNSSARVKTQIGSLQNLDDRDEAARLLAEGELVAFFNRGVNAIWLDAMNSKALDAIPKIKGLQRVGKPLSLTIRFDLLIHMIDRTKISPSARKFLNDFKDLKQAIGSLCFLRFPVQEKYLPELPKSAVSIDKSGTPWIQNWDANGHAPTEDLLNRAEKMGVTYAGVTSMNLSGEPEVVDQAEAAEFCKMHGISMYLNDSLVHPHVKGSYTIFTLSKRRIELTREGNIPGRVIEKIIGGKAVSGQHTKLPKHSQMEFPEILYQNLTPQKIREAVLMYITGVDPLEINKKLSQT